MAKTAARLTMTRRTLFGSHLYGQIVVPLIAASVFLAMSASVAAAYFVHDLTTKWITEVADATTTSVLQGWTESDGVRQDYVRILATDPTTVAAANAGDEAVLHSQVVRDAKLLASGSVAVVNRSGVVVTSAGLGAPSVGKPLPGLPSLRSADSSSVGTMVRSTKMTSTISSLGWLGPKRAYALVVTTPLTDALLKRISGAAVGGFCFYTTAGQHVACTVSSALPDGPRQALKQSLLDGGPTLRDAIAQAGKTGVGHATLTVGADRYLVVARPVSSAGLPFGAFDGYIVGSVSQAASDEAARMSMGLIFAWSIVAVMAFVALGFWVARRVSSPLVELTQGARRIADGDFSTKVHVPGGNELAMLGETFNDMTDSLRDRSDSLTKKVLELATLYEMSRALGSTLDMDDLLGSTLRSALRIFDLDVGHVALRDRETGVLAIRAVRGGAGEPTGTEAVRSSMAEWVVREGRPLIFNPDSGSIESQVDTLTGAKAALCVPLVSAEGTIGAITVGSSNADYRFDGDDVRLLSTIANHATIAVGNIELFMSLQEAYLDTVRSLAAAVDAKDTYTRGHSDKVATYSTMIAQRLGLSHEQLTALEMAAYLHDIGKIGIPEAILLKPDRLTDEQMAQMRHHPLIGANILKPVAFPWAITPIVRHHHEYWDGKGYPAGLQGEEIPLLARILCVADSYEAMTADRPYRAGRSAGDAIEELRRCSGTQFDPRVVDTMVAAIEELEINGSGVLGDTGEDVSVEEARAIFAALVDGVLASFRRLGGPRLASNVATEIDEYFEANRLPYRLVRGRLTFADEPGDNIVVELDEMRSALHYIDTVIGHVSGGTLVDHFYNDALDGFSARMRRLTEVLEFHACA